MVNGVAQVQVFGPQKYAVRIQLDPKAHGARGIGIDEVANAVAAGNVNLPTGILWGPHRAYTVQANGQLENAAAFRPLVVAYRNGAPVRLQDVGQVLDDVQNNKTAGWFDGNRAILLAIQRQPGTNTVEVADGVRALMATLQAQLPASVEVRTLYDRSAVHPRVGRRREVHAAPHARPRRAGDLPVPAEHLRDRDPEPGAAALDRRHVRRDVAARLQPRQPLADGAHALGRLRGGRRHRDAREHRAPHGDGETGACEAAFDGSKEIGFTILSMTLSLAAVFIPVLFMGGIVGRLFHEFAVTIGVAILVSGFVSLTLTPMLCSRFLRASHGVTHGRWFNASERVYERVLKWYEDTLGWVMNRRPLAMGVSAAILIGTVALFVIVPKGFLPSEDNGQAIGTTETIQGTSFEAMKQHQLQIMGIVAQDPNVLDFMSFVGGGAINQGRIIMHLKPRADRKLSADQVIQRLTPKLAVVPGIRVYLQNPPPIRIGGRLTKSLYQFTLQGPDMPALYEGSKQLEAKLHDLPDLIDVTSDLQITNPQATVVINRDRAASLGVTAEQVERALYNAYGSGQVSTIYTPTNQYWVDMELLPEYQQRPLGPEPAVHPLAERQPRPARFHGDAELERRTADREPLGTASLGHASPST